jgi:very-short-patch-repair endonuclease
MYYISEALCQQNGIPAPKAEHRFTELRKWRFDFAWVEQKVALEVEGGAFSKGRHTRGSGFVKDMEKYSEAAALGWLIIRVTPQQLYDTRTFNWIKAALSHSRT